MADTEREDRTLPATPRRLEKAREEGQVARSRELASLIVVGAAFGSLALSGPALWDASLGLLREGLAFDAAGARNPSAALDRLSGLGVKALVAYGPFLLVMLAAAVAAPLALGGWLFTWKPLHPDFGRMDPLGGLGRLVSREAWIELGKSTLKAIAVGGIAAWATWSVVPQLAATASTGALTSAFALSLQALTFGGACLLGALALLAVVDVPLTLRTHALRLRMTPQELREEHRETEGDPQLKGRIRQQQRAIARRRMMAKVPTATVVVTNPTHYAVAIDWKEGMRAPRVVAKGTGEVAQRIKDVARAAGVPLLEAPPLARALNRHVELDAEVPAALYQAVAQVLAWVFQVRTARPGRYPKAPDVVVPEGLDPLASGDEA